MAIDCRGENTENIQGRQTDCGHVQDGQLSSEPAKALGSALVSWPWTYRYNTRQNVGKLLMRLSPQVQIQLPYASVLLFSLAVYCYITRIVISLTLVSAGSGR